jgi:hypothetical protein
MSAFRLSLLIRIAETDSPVSITGVGLDPVEEPGLLRAKGGRSLIARARAYCNYGSPGPKYRTLGLL